MINGRFIGTKAEIASDLALIIGVGTRFLRSPRALSEASVAMKMSWTSSRRTTRVKEIAYCLLGLFDVNMPTFYGEGRKASTRLQLEIIRKSNDESIFAWTCDDRSSGLLASWPTALSDSGNVVSILVENSQRLPYSMTLGLELQMASESNPNIENSGTRCGVRGCSLSLGITAEYGRGRYRALHSVLPICYQPEQYEQKACTSHLTWRSRLLTIAAA